MGDNFGQVPCHCQLTIHAVRPAFLTGPAKDLTDNGIVA